VARTASFVPVFEPAFRVTLVSAVFGALGVALLFLLLLARTGSRTAALGAAAAFGLSFTFWQFAAVAEVYTLMTFLFIAMLFLADRLQREAPGHAALLLAFVTGLLLSQQPLNVAAIPGLIVLVLLFAAVRRELIAGPRWPLRLAALLLPVTLYLYTYLVDRGHSPMNWLDHYGRFVAESQGVDAARMESFFGRIRFQMTIERLTPQFPGAGEYVRSAYDWARHLFYVEFPLVASLVAVAGLAGAWRRGRKHTLFLLVLAAPYLMLALSNWGERQWGERYAYSLPVNVVFTVFVAHGIAAAGRRRVLAAIAALLVAVTPLLRYAPASPLSRWPNPIVATAGGEGTQPAFANLGARNDRGKEYAERIAGMVEPGSLILGGWRQANVLFYHQIVNGALGGVTISYRLPLASQIGALVSQSGSTRIYIAGPMNEDGGGFVIEDTRSVIAGESIHRVRLAETPAPATE